MKVENVGQGKIKLECSYDEIAKVVSVLDKHWLLNDDADIKQLAYEIHNPKVVVEK